MSLSAISYQPSLSNLEHNDQDNETQFTLQGVPICFANGLRRCMISHIPVIQLSVDPEKKARWTNMTRFHNEIIEERLLSIPVHTKQLDNLPGKYALEIDVINESEHMLIITTEPQYFRIKNKETGKYMDDSEVMGLFPKSSKTAMPIDFLRLNAKIGNIPAPRLSLTTDFKVSTAGKDSKCSCVFVGMGNSPDPVLVKEAWEEKEREIKIKMPNITKEEIESERRDFMTLDAQRYFKENSYDFKMQMVGVYSWSEIGHLACEILDQMLAKLAMDIETGIAMILPSNTTMEYSWDLKIGGDCYTVGKILEWVLYVSYYLSTEMGGKLDEPVLSFCAFRKSHPHDDEATLRFAFVKETDKGEIQNYLLSGLNDSRKVVKAMHGLFV